MIFSVHITWPATFPQVTHNESPVTPLTSCGTVLKESDDLDILGMTFDSKINFEKRLRTVS